MEYDIIAGKLGNFYAQKDPNDSACATTTLYPEIYPIMQYTRLKDKNGKEIYEGDIVKGMNIISYPNEDKIYRSGIVKYKHCSFVAVPFGMEEFNMVALGEWCEVIGNIYENPELMELWSDE